MMNTYVGAGPLDLSELLNLERQLAATLSEAADEIAHSECFDDEQRAEVYTIVQALLSDTDAHRAAIEQLSRSRCDA
jgi:hypothetical protein